MSNTIRIRTSGGSTTDKVSDKYLKVKLDQEFDFIEILSLKISQEDTYRKFCSDYGVVVGRVSINNGFGVPNAKVSVFIPLDDVDKLDPVIKGLYPYEVITDKDDTGVRYNLLPKEGDPTNECSTPIGTFPTKREVLDNATLLEVYCKYYKFTTTTNHAGDFMLFGVPVGTYTVHVDADISDIGIASQRPYDLISQGTPPKMFKTPTKFNGDKNLDKLIQVKTLNAGVNVQPFWGDQENCEIGISLLDFDLNYSVRPAAIFMGSIYGDQQKHSINKRCRPRKKLGNLCEQVAGPGSINMIRKTIDGQIEAFDVEGGRVIDDDGAWAYQIPMNLDYMVTNEEGDLILSQDPNKGIPTRARVRFNIGMDETGGEGRLRTRARYLVPNNPKNTGELDYTFGDETLETSFRDLYWNKIYSVSNYISRYQKNAKVRPVKSRSITAIKDVDACAGDKTPFPYNRVNSELNPIFFIICLIIKIIAFLIYIMNALLIPLINVIIAAINSVMNAIVSVVCGIVGAINSVSSLLGLTLTCGLSWNNIEPIGCVFVMCPVDDGSSFAPGCIKNGGLDSGAAWKAADDKAAPLTYYANDGFTGHNEPFSAAGLDDCIAFEMAKALNMFQFDFYNDWVNGSLFGFLLKYKKKKKGREVFCEYDCNDFGISSGGVDGNDNGVSDNSCHNELLLDTCFDNGNNWQTGSQDSGTIREGLIKKVGDEFFYAATTHTTQFKLFATDIISLGSIFNCDWQGIPKVNDLLIQTTYKLPPDIQELHDDGTTVDVCGQVDIGTPAGSATGGLFFSINCLGLHVSERQCLNLRHICEMGVDIDQAQEDPSTGVIIVPSDCIIGSNDIDDNKGKWFRDVFFGLNSSATPWVGINYLNIPPLGYDTNFNLGDNSIYDFTAGPTANGLDYKNFRNYSAGKDAYGQTDHSYFFYFGLLPGKTGLDKMNERFFTHCQQTVTYDILIQATTVASIGASTGSMTFSFIGGYGPYTYTITGVAPTVYGPTTGSVGATIINPIPTTATGLPPGTYLISGLDSHGNPVTKTVTVSGPPAFYCTVTVTKNASAAGINDGEIKINGVGGGSGTYNYQLYNGSNTLLTSGSLTSIPFAVSSTLAVDTTVGYKVVVYDTSSPVSACTTIGLTISGPTTVVFTPTSTNVTCYGGNNGSITLNTTGGQTPYTFMTTGPNYTSSSPTMTGLKAGTYVSNVVDSLGTPATTTNVITQPPQLVLNPSLTYLVGKQCDPTQYIIPFMYAAGATPSELTGVSPLNLELSIDTGIWTPYTSAYINPSSPTTTPIYIYVPAGLGTNVRIRFKNPTNTCFSNVINILKTSMEIPSVTLAINNASSIAQCVPGIAYATINIIRDNVRVPINVEYSFNSTTWFATTPPTASLTTFAFNIPVAIGTPNTVTTHTIYIRVTDIKGCQVINSINIVVPNTTLTLNVSSGGLILTGPNAGKYQHNVSVNGGSGSYPTNPSGTYYTVNPTETYTVIDSFGCTKTTTG